MRTTVWYMRVLLLVVFMTAGRSFADGQRVLSASFGDGGTWRIFADEPWWALVDVRDMLNIFHPLSIPETHNAAGASRDLIIPADWQRRGRGSLPTSGQGSDGGNGDALVNRRRPGDVGSACGVSQR